MLKKIKILSILGLTLIFSSIVPETYSYLRSSTSTIPMEFKAKEGFAELESPEKDTIHNSEAPLSDDVISQPQANGESNKEIHSGSNEALDYDTDTTNGPQNDPIYRVRTDWADEKSQLGAFNNLENARAVIAKYPEYKVFDSCGNEVK
jgi:hypothetical protein